MCDRTVRPIEAGQEGNARSICQTGNRLQTSPALERIEGTAAWLPER